MLDRVQLTEAYAARLLDAIRATLAQRPNEAQFRRRVDALLEQFAEESGLEPLVRAEVTLAPGRADAVFNRLVIEYERPGSLRGSMSNKATRHAVGQAEGYLRALAEQEHHDLSRVAGLVLDGFYMVFVRFHGGKRVDEPPVAVNKESLRRALRWLSSTSSGIALTAENLCRDFDMEQERTLAVIRALTESLGDSLAISPEGAVARLFEQWRLLFSESIEYTEAFSGRKLESIRKWTERLNEPAVQPERFFFALHTYFALLSKLLAWLALSRHFAVKMGAPLFGQLESASDTDLRSHLEEMESGGVFRKYGFTNLLEGDLFAWYLRVWTGRVAFAVRGLVQRLSDYDPTTLALDPDQTRDLLKKLYHYLLPREIRHNLGEYYTPDWLAERLLHQVDVQFMTSEPGRLATEGPVRRKLTSLRWLDPACGSGTFLVLLIRRYRELAAAVLMPEHELLGIVLHSIVGFDLNPLAVIVARVNYILALLDLLEYRQGDITIPVFLADSILSPLVDDGLFAQDIYQVKTAVGVFSVPTEALTHGRFARVCELLEESVLAEVVPEAAVERISRQWAMGKGEEARMSTATAAQLMRLFEQLLEIHKQGMNGRWARILENSLAPITCGQFDYVVGNPPWVNWEHLPDGYRQRVLPLWHRYGLVPPRGLQSILGSSKMDLSALMICVAADNYLLPGGRLGFVVTQSLLKTVGAGRSFRRFRIREDGPFLGVLHVDDMVELMPFEGASNRTAILLLEKGRRTTYPVPYTLWRKRHGAGLGYDSTLPEVRAGTKRIRLLAEPVDPEDEASIWLTARGAVLPAVRKALGRSDYAAHAGAYSGGANAVFWVTVQDVLPDGQVLVTNIVSGAKTKVASTSAMIEPILLYPLLRAADVSRWSARPRAHIIVTRWPGSGKKAIPKTELQVVAPRTYAYLKSLEPVLTGRKDSVLRRAMAAGTPFYALAAVSEYTFAPWKVVWPNIASSIEAAVVGLSEGKAVIPQHIVTLVACGSADEAHYICAVMNSSLVNFAVCSYSQTGGKSFGDPHVLEHIRIPRYDPQNGIHCALSSLSQRAHELVGQQGVAQLAHIEADIDTYCGALWGLSDGELETVRRNLNDIRGPLLHDS